jgi:hypothetical protein
MKAIIYQSLILAFLIVLPVEGRPVDTNVVKYFPMKLGNIWIYHYTTTHVYNTNHYYRDIIDSTLLVNGKTFFRFKETCRYISGYPPCGSPTYYYYRIDSTTGIVFQYVQSGGCITLPNYWKLDSLQAKLHDSVRECVSGQVTFACTDTSLNVVFGVTKSTRLFVLDIFEYYESRKYAKDLGPLNHYIAGVTGHWTWQLVGCVINGIVYGDTTFITGIQKISAEIPTVYNLYQNYPNPFNPVMKIKFDVPLESRLRGNNNVTLKIYDVLGKEITTLVNEKLSSGMYEVEWDGTNYPSGVYFYKLITDNYSETKKMVLIK